MSYYVLFPTTSQSISVARVAYIGNYDGSNSWGTVDANGNGILNTPINMHSWAGKTVYVNTSGLTTPVPANVNLDFFRGKYIFYSDYGGTGPPTDPSGGAEFAAGNF